MSDSIESIRPENMLKVIFYKHQSKISLQFTYGDHDSGGKDWRWIYFNKDDKTLKLFKNRIKKYYFNIEFDSENNELLETTQFKIRVSE